MSRYFHVSFFYAGLKGNECNRECNDALIAADKNINKLETVLASEGMQMKYAYSWPDGSYWQFLRTSKKTTVNEVFALLNIHLLKLKLLENLAVEKVLLTDGRRNPHKTGCKTLKQYMDKS